MKKWKITGCITVCILVMSGYFFVSHVTAKDSIISLTAKLTIKADKADEFAKVMKEIVPKVRTEKGNITYTMLRSKENPRVFLFFEEYKDQAAIQAHGKHLGELGLDFSAYFDGPVEAEYYEKIAE
ncbi:MAG: putative quinol monooxygenase [Desulfobacteraceae bacterium]|jgi:quinol monooxygenase YgiN